MNTRNHWAIAVGLALLYASGFYLPLAGSYSYFLPAVGGQILYPSVVAILVISPLAAWFYSRYGEEGRSSLWGGTIVAVLCWIAVIGAFSAAGYSALNIALIISGTQVLGDATRWTRLVLVIAGLATSIVAVHSMRRHWGGILRLLSILGYAYAILAAIRIDHLPHLAFPFVDNRTPTTAHANSNGAAVAQDSAASTPRSRQVVWIVLDELDYDDTLGQPAGRKNPPMPNLEQLARVGVSAIDAYSPAKDTVASIPMLLTGYPAIGQDFKGGALRLKTRSAGVRILQESDSIFGHLPDGPNSAAILGFYHPYCSLFPSVSTCIASPYINAGRWFDALAFFSQPAIETARFLPASGQYLPGAFFRWFEPMYHITEDTLRELPRFLSLEDKSLVFIHVNLPHLPGDYSQRWLHLKTVGNDGEVYRRNLRLADQLVGEAVSILQGRSKRQDILLVVSADHWFRIESPLAVRRVPWIAWRVGESDGIRLNTRISTIHTADLILSYLRRQIDSQSQINAWWQDKPFYPTLMPHGFNY